MHAQFPSQGVKLSLGAEGSVPGPAESPGWAQGPGEAHLGSSGTAPLSPGSASRGHLRWHLGCASAGDTRASFLEWEPRISVQWGIEG